MGRESGKIGDACLIAKVGGAHAGFLREARKKYGERQLESGIRSYTRQIEQHERRINDPASKPGVADQSTDDVWFLVHRKWHRDIARLAQQREIFRGLLKEIRDGKVTGRD